VSPCPPLPMPRQMSLLVAAALCSTLAGAAVEAASEAPASQESFGPLGVRPARAEEAYPWFKRAGNHHGGSVSFVAPSNFSEKPAWMWPNEGDELFRHTPVIDHEKNIYAATSFGFVRKFSPAGKLLWMWRTSASEGRIVTSPFLYEGKLFITSCGDGKPVLIWVWCLDMETGKVLWQARGPPYPTNQDSHTVHVAEGVILGAMMALPKDYEGNDRIYALNATDGSSLWEYQLNDGGVVWNFMPSTPGDGTLFFASSCGVARRLRLSNGELLWTGAVKEPSRGMCGTGGGVLGPDGVFYVESNWATGDVREPLPGVAVCSITAQYCPLGFGLLVAYRAEDGAVLWKRRLRPGHGGMQYPTVATIAGRLTVVAGIGQNPDLSPIGMGPKFLPFYLRLGIQLLQVRSWHLRRLLGVPVKPNGVSAYDAATGEELWHFAEEPNDHHGAEGDEGPMLGRLQKAHQQGDPRTEVLCGPDNWGIPAVGGDGTVYAASGSSGKLYAIRDADGNGVIADSEVSTFASGVAFLNNPALAPGMLVVSPCWGPMYVWRSEAE